MTARRRSPEPVRRLLGHWERQPEFGEPVGCVASTFTFDAGFFEEECLARFAGIESDTREDRQAYLVEREERLSQLHASVLVDSSHTPRSRSLRWNVFPVTVPGGGILHAKVSLLAWRHRIRLLVGSANLTEPGYRKNYEQMAVLDFGPGQRLPRSLLGDALRFLREMAMLTAGSANDGPKRALARCLEQVERTAAAWPEARWPRGGAQAHFIPVWPGGPSLFERLATRLWRAPGPDMASVMSPFFDAGRGVRDVVDALVGIMSVRGVRTVEFVAPGRKHANGCIEVELPDAVRKPWGRRREHTFAYVHARDDEGESRELHAKSLWLERGERATFIVGSSNFTRAGTGVGTGPCNVEANLVYVIPDSHTRFGDSCMDAYPPHEEFDPQREEVRFLKSAPDRTPDAATSVPLPEAFGLALYRAGKGGSRIELAIGEDAPSSFDIFREDETRVATHRLWARRGRPEWLVQPWPVARPPSCLLVRWRRGGGQPRLSVWPVNVGDPAELPPPEELRSLDLEELLEILTSARPLHEAVAMVLRRRATRQRATHGPIVDPHKKVDTRNFLLKRVRRVSAALEGMRERLERPAFGIEGLRWRLEGPVGPLALARRLAEQEGQGAAFMIAEVALTLRHTDWSMLQQGLGRAPVKAAVASVLRELDRLADEHPAPPNLARYVDACFAQVKP